jgi:hypothetical protein
MFSRAYPGQAPNESVLLMQTFALRIADTEICRFVLDGNPVNYAAASNLAQVKSATKAALQVCRKGTSRSGSLNNIGGMSGGGGDGPCWYRNGAHRREPCASLKKNQDYFGSSGKGQQTGKGYKSGKGKGKPKGQSEGSSSRYADKRLSNITPDGTTSSDHPEPNNNGSIPRPIDYVRIGCNGKDVVCTALVDSGNTGNNCISYTLFQRLGLSDDDLQPVRGLKLVCTA